MGLLDEMNALISGLGPSEDEKRQARAQAAIMAGLGMFGARPRYLAQDLSRAAIGGVMDYNQQMRDSGEDKLKRIAVAQQMQQMLAQRQAAQQAQELQQRIGGAFTGTVPNLQAMGPGGPTPANAAAVAPVPMADQYMKAAMLAAQSGRPDLAEKYANLAKAGQEEYSTTPQVVRDEKTGKLRLAQFSKGGGIKTAEGLSPAEKLHFADAGGVAGVGMNPYTGAVESQGMPKTMTPSELDASKRGWASYGLSKNADARAAEAAKSGGEGGKWQYDATRGMRVNPTTGVAEPVMVGGEPMGGTQETKAKQSAGKVMNIVNEAEKYLDSATGSYGGAVMDQAARIFGSSTEGATAIAQLQALEGALMLNQPRMEGPQSDKDTAIYKQMAGKIGDPTVPTAQKKAALQVIKNLNKKYIGEGASSGATGGWSATEIK